MSTVAVNEKPVVLFILLDFFDENSNPGRININLRPQLRWIAVCLVMVNFSLGLR